MLASSTGGPGFNPQSRTASYQRRYKNGTSSALVYHWTFKRENTGSFSRIKIGQINVMDKIWDRKSFEVGGHWPLWRGWKNRMTTQNQHKSIPKKQQPKKTPNRLNVEYCCLSCISRNDETSVSGGILAVRWLWIQKRRWRLSCDWCVCKRICTLSFTTSLYLNDLQIRSIPLSRLAHCIHIP